jgi:hypothetical protein
MKKFLFIVILLIIIGGAAFFLGWAQLTVPPGSYGVMRSKTYGLEKQLIRDGEFRWVWYKLLPTNVKISVYTLGPVRRSIESSGSLSSGDTYAALAGLEADFSWRISGELEFSVNPDFLPEIIERESIADDAALRNAEQRLAERIESFVLRQLRSYAETNEEKMEDLILSGSIPELENDIQSAFPEVKDISVTVKVVRYPDFELYRSVKALYREYIERQSALLNPAVNREAESRIEVRLRLDELARYGELLTQYPILLQYLALEKGITPAAIPGTAPSER